MGGFGRLMAKDVEVDGVAHGFVAGVAGVEVVAGVGGGGEGGGVGGVAGGLIEVDEAVEVRGGANPVVEGLADGVAGGRGVAAAEVGREGGAEDLDAVGVGTAGELG